MKQGLAGWRVDMITAAVVVLAMLMPAGLVGCSQGVHASAAEPEAAEVFGTALDAGTGAPLVGVLIQGPRASRAVTDLAGRFRLRGLRAGDCGLLTATRGQVFHGELPLRPLQPGAFEVVFHLRASD